MTTPKNYTDEKGTKQQGYIKNGVTYTDSSLTNRVATGSVVDTNGGTFYKGAERDYGVKIDPAGANDDSFNLHGKNYKTYYDNNGTAFVDAGKTVKVPYGTTLYKNGAEYRNDSTFGQIPTLGGARTEYNNSINSNYGYLQKAADAQKSAVQARTNQQIRALDRRAREIADEKREADRLSYNAYLQAINPYGARAQEAARLGLSNSGFSETSLLSLGNTYQMALAGNEKARAKAMSDLTILIDQARTEGNRQEYEIFANMYNNLADLRTKQAQTNAELDLAGAKMLAEKEEREAKSYAEMEERDSARREDIAAFVMNALYKGEMTYEQLSKLLDVPTETLKALVKEYIR